MIEMKPKTQTILSIANNDHCQLEENGKAKLQVEKDESGPDGDYNPHDYGSTKHAINYVGAIVHLVRSTIGTGILLLPFAFKSVGYGIGIVGTVIIGLLYVSNLHALLFTEYQLCRRLKVRNLTFVGVVDNSFAYGPKQTRRFGPYLKSLLYFYYGVPTGCAVYMIIIADNCRHIYQHLGGQQLALVHSLSAILLPIILLALIPKLKFLVPLSMLTNVFTVVNILIILLYSFDLRAWRRNAHLVEDVSQLPRFFAIMLQSLIATGMILPLKNDMRKPKSFASPLGVLNVSFCALTILFGTFGLVGYLNYGDAVHDNVLSNLPVDHLLTICVYILYTLALCVTYTLLFYVYYDTIWSNFLQQHVANTRYEKSSQYGLRICINVAAYIMAIAVPNFSLFSSLVGTIGIIIEIGLPSTLQLLVLSTSEDVTPVAFRHCLVKNLTIILIAVTMFAMSLKTCISDVIRLYTLK